MENVVLTIHLILALLLIGIVLIQRSEGGGLGIGGGGAMTGRQQATAMTKLTWLLAIGFIITSITLTILAAAGSTGGSVVDQFGGSLPEPEAPAPALGGDLLPPANPDAPLTPPRVDEVPAPAPATGD
jgi:preprotein translocase subunit SecG